MLRYQCLWFLDGTRVGQVVHAKTPKDACAYLLSTELNGYQLVPTARRDIRIEGTFCIIGPRSEKWYELRKIARETAQGVLGEEGNIMCRNFRSIEDVWRIAGEKTSKGITVKQLYGLLQLQIKAGNGDKHILMTDDDEINGLHILFDGAIGDESQVQEYLNETGWNRYYTAKDTVILL